MILLITMSIDPHTDLIVDALKKKGAPFFRYNTDLADRYCIEVSMDGGVVSNSRNGKSVKLKEVGGVWLRRRLSPKILKDVHEDYRAYLDEQWQLFTEILLASIDDKVCWINHPLAMEAAKNKFRQLQIARDKEIKGIK